LITQLFKSPCDCFNLLSFLNFAIFPTWVTPRPLHQYLRLRHRLLQQQLQHHLQLQLQLQLQPNQLPKAEVGVGVVMMMMM
jgi:hypothetical protein